MGMQEVGIRLSLDGQSVVAAAQNIAGAFAKITEKIKEAEAAGDSELAEKYTKQAASLQHIYNGMANGSQGAGGNSGAGGGQGQVVQALQQGSNTVQDVVNQAGRGDVMGAALSGTKGGLDIVGRIGDTTAKVAGIAGVGLLPGMIINSLSGFYEQQMQSAMAINARLNNTERQSISTARYKTLSDEEKKNYEQFEYTIRNRNGKREKRTAYRETEAYRTEINSKNIKDAFQQAADAAIKLGYSMEEGMAAVREATQYGYTGKGVYSAAENVLGWQRITDVDSGALMAYKGDIHRYGGDKGLDSLAMAYRVNEKTGMSKGQFSETLRALQTVFEDGISKGFVKGTAEIGTTLTALYKASGKSELWQGEQGVKRYLQMSNAVSSATSLNSVTDILSYKAAASMSDSAKNNVFESAGLSGRKNGGKGYGYVDNMILLEAGVNADLLEKQREYVMQTAGKENKEGQIELYRQMYGLNYTGATKVFEMMQKGFGTGADRQAIAADITTMQSSAEYVSDEKKALETSQQIRKEIANIGATLLPIKTSVMDMAINLTKNVAAYSKGEIDTFEFGKNIIGNKAPTLSPEEKYKKTLARYKLAQKRVKDIQEMGLEDMDENMTGITAGQKSREELNRTLQALNETLKEFPELTEQAMKDGVGKGLEGSTLEVHDMSGAAP